MFVYSELNIMVRVNEIEYLNNVIKVTNYILI